MTTGAVYPRMGSSITSRNSTSCNKQIPKTNILKHCSWLGFHKGTQMNAHLLVPAVVRLCHVMSHCGTLKSKGNQELLQGRRQFVFDLVQSTKAGV